MSEEKDYIRAVIDTLITKQNTVLANYPPEKRQGMNGRAASLWIQWKDGIRAYDICFTTNNGVQWKPPDMSVRNKVWMTEDTFYLIAVGAKDIKEAKDHGEIKVSGEHSLYDTLEIKGVFDDLKDKILRPMFEQKLLTP